MNHIANRTQSRTQRATLTTYPIGTWRNERTKKEVHQVLYFYQAGSERYTVTVYRKTK